jgi:O-antigen/teichoic acid export membrane protein
LISKSSSKKNLLYNFLNFLLGILYGLIVPAFLIRYIGIESYGIVQITLSLMMFAGIIAGSLNEAISRKFTIDIQTRDYHQANTTFNTALFTYGILLLLMLIIVYFVSMNVEKLFIIPSQLIDESHYLFFLNLSGFLLVLFSSVFLAPAFSLNRLDLFQISNIIRNILRLLLVIILVLFISDSLIMVGLSSFIPSVTGLIYSVIICWKLAPFLRISLQKVNWHQMKYFFTFSSWTIINQIGILIFLYIDVILINILIGAKESGEYAAVMQWSALVRNLSGVMTQFFAPVIMIYYSRKLSKLLNKTILEALYYTGVFITIPVSLIIVYAEDILRIWLGENYIHLTFPLQVSLFHVVINYSFVILITLTLAHNKVKDLAIWSLFFGLLHIAVSIMLITFFGMGIMAPIVSGAVILMIKNVIFMPLFISKFVEIKPKMIHWIVVKIFFGMGIVAIVGLLNKHLFTCNNLFELLLNVSSSIFLSLIIIWNIMIEKKYKIKVNEVLIKKPFNRGE